VRRQGWGRREEGGGNGRGGREGNGRGGREGRRRRKGVKGVSEGEGEG